MTTPIVMGVPIAPIATATPRLPVRTGVRMPDGSYVLRAGLTPCAKATSAVSIVARAATSTRFEMNAILNDDDERVAIACVESPSLIGQLYTHELQALVESWVASADHEGAHWTPFLDALCDYPWGPGAEPWTRIRDDQRSSISTRLTRLAHWVRRQKRWQCVLPLCGFTSVTIRDLIVRNGNNLPSELIAHLVASDVSLVMAVGSCGGMSTATAQWALEAFSGHAAEASLDTAEIVIFLDRCASRLPETVEAQTILATAVDAVRGGVGQSAVRHVRDDLLAACRRAIEQQPVSRETVSRFATFRDDTLRQFALELLRHVRRRS